MATEDSRHRRHGTARAAIVTALLLAACLLPVGTAEGQEPDTITYAEAVRIALDRNADLRRARTDVDLRDAVEVREYMDFLPRFDLSSGVSRSFGRSFSPEEGQILSETSDFFGVDIAASLDLFDGFERFAAVRRAGLEQEASARRLERTREDVVFQVIERFTTLLQNRQLAAVREQELAAQEDLLEQVEALVEVGRRPVSDLYQQQAVRAEAEALLVEARREVELSKTQLIQVLQLDPLEEYAFEAGADSAAIEAAIEAEAADPVGPDRNLRQLLEAALGRRADLAALEAGVAAGRAGVDVAQAGYWPTLSVTFGYGSDWSSEALQPIPGTGEDPREVTIVPEDGPPVTFPVPGTGIDPDFRHPTFFDQLDARRGGSFRLSLSLPVFDRLQTRTAVEQAQAELLNARYDYQERRQLVALQVRQAVLDHRSARAQLAASEERLQAAGQAREAARRRYELGAATFVEVAQAESQYVSARSARVRAGYQTLLTRRLIEYYTGGLEPGAELYRTGEAP